MLFCKTKEQDIKPCSDVVPLAGDSPFRGNVDFGRQKGCRPTLVDLNRHGSTRYVSNEKLLRQLALFQEFSGAAGRSRTGTGY